jgi:hypothetical protein
VDQLSPPFRIALVAMLAVCALWFTVLKPKDPAADAPLPTAPGATGLANDVNAAKGAATTSDAADAKVQNATGGTAAKPAATAKNAAPATAKHAAPATAKHAAPATAKHAAPATAKHAAPAATPTAATPKPKPAAPADPAKPLLSALDAKKAVVMLVYNPKGIDDRAVREAVTGTDRHHGKVVVKAVPVSQVGRYGAITRGAQILESPTVLVIAPDRKARAIVGFTTTAELDQAVGDALASAKK